MVARKKYAATIILICIGFLAGAQIRVVPIDRSVPQKPDPGARITEEILELPFWDDFSTSYGQPDPLKWDDSENVWVGNGMGINPPSFNVASFDGLDVNGKPYSLDVLSDGKTDVLTSHHINLSELSVNDNVRISFYFQIKGNGELPNENDSLRLEFLNSDNEWVKIWSVIGTDQEPDIFYKRDFGLNSNDFYHGNFQFRFTSFGRQAGPFDTWNLDYIYLNRFDSRRDFPDRAINRGATSFLNDYTSVPIHHFNANPDEMLNFVSAGAYNLYDSLQPSNFTVFAKIESLQEDLTFATDYDTLAHEEFSSFPNPITTGTRSISMTTSGKLDPGKIKSDSLAYIDITLYMNTDDNQPPDYRTLYAPLDFRINDTLSTLYTLSNYYAYDDGSAEYAAGLNFAGDMIAYMFPVQYDDPDTLVSVDMYFPNFNSSGSKSIELIVWDSLSNDPDKIAYSQPLIIRQSEGIDDFITYDLAQSVIVKDTFYIGWRQTSAGNIDIGLDKNTESGGRMFYNLDGSWNQNVVVSGSLMLRPRFGKGDIITSNQYPVNLTLKIYPNPGNGRYNIQGIKDKKGNLSVYSLQGSQVPFQYQNNLLDITGNPPGIYIIRISQDNAIFTRKILYK